MPFFPSIVFRLRHVTAWPGLAAVPDSVAEGGRGEEASGGGNSGHSVSLCSLRVKFYSSDKCRSEQCPGSRCCGVSGEQRGPRGVPLMASVPA